MNNQQFRNLLLNNSNRKDGSNAPTPPSTTRPSATPALGSRKTSSIPMTPRQVGGRANINAEFARQLAERNAKAAPAKKFKSSAPKGVKLVAGYTDRAKDRQEKEKEDGDGDGEEDDMAQRIGKLEESMKLGQIDRETFEGLVQEITGGDISLTHLVKGLDRKLLERIRKGENVQSATPKNDADGEEPNVEDEFDQLAMHEVAPVVRPKAEKKGEMAPPSKTAGVKRSRDTILAELKAQRQAAAEAAAAEHLKKYPTLGPGFRRVGANGETSRIEIDDKGREVLIITNPDGTEKRKVRKQKVEESAEPERKYLEDPNKPLNINMETLPQPKKEENEDSEDDDIFAGVGANYNPLADIEDSDDDSSEDEDEDEGGVRPTELATVESEDEGEMKEDNTEPSAHASPLLPPASSTPTATLPRRNYFDDTPSQPSSSQTSAADATVRAALLKVRNLDASSSLLADTEEARLKKRAAQLAAQDRDMEDLDMGFGGSRFDDAEEMEQEGEKVKFSEWRGLGADDDDEEGGGRGSKKRKRGPKKKKGDKNSAADVLMVMERQKGTKTLG